MYKIGLPWRGVGEADDGEQQIVETERHLMAKDGGLKRGRTKIILMHGANEMTNASGRVCLEEQENDADDGEKDDVKWAGRMEYSGSVNDNSDAMSGKNLATIWLGGVVDVFLGRGVAESNNEWEDKVEHLDSVMHEEAGWKVGPDLNLGEKTYFDEGKGIDLGSYWNVGDQKCFWYVR